MSTILISNAGQKVSLMPVEQGYSRQIRFMLPHILRVNSRATPYGVTKLHSTLGQAAACSLTTPNHYLNQWMVYQTSDLTCHSPQGYFTADAPSINYSNVLEIYTCKFPVASPRGQWVNNHSLFIYMGMIYPHPHPPSPTHPQTRPPPLSSYRPAI